MSAISLAVSAFFKRAARTTELALGRPTFADTSWSVSFPLSFAYPMDLFQERKLSGKTPKSQDFCSDYCSDIGGGNEAFVLFPRV